MSLLMSAMLLATSVSGAPELARRAAPVQQLSLADGGGNPDRVREPGGGSGGGPRSGGEVREPPTGERAAGGSGAPHGGGDIREPRAGGGGAGAGTAAEPRSTEHGSGGGGSGGGRAADGSSGRNSGGGSGGGSGNGGSGNGGSGNSGSGNSGHGSSNSGSGNSGSGNSGRGSSNSGRGNSSSGGGAEATELVTAHSSESVESTVELRQLAAREAPEFDNQGFPVRRGEVIGLDLSPAEFARVRALGFEVSGKSDLRSLDLNIVRLRAPEGMKVGDAIRLLSEAGQKTDAVYDFDHFYGVNGYEDGDARVKATPPPLGNLWIGMIDTGVARHVALQGVRVISRDFAHNPAGAPAPSKHGTAVASILARQGAGRITSANIFTADGKPYAAADTIAEALDWLVQQKAPVINISLAGPRNILLDRVVARAIAKGHIIVAAAGNGGPTAAPAYPSAIDGVVAATAVDTANQVYRYANQGDYIFISAPGVGVEAASGDGTLAAFSGTSFAAPYVAASIARCHLKLTASACVDTLRSSAIDLGAPGKDAVYGWGLIRN